MHVVDLLASYVELGQPATRKQIEQLACTTEHLEERARLVALAQADQYQQEVLPRFHNTAVDIPSWIFSAYW